MKHAIRTLVLVAGAVLSGWAAAAGGATATQGMYPEQAFRPGSVIHAARGAGDPKRPFVRMLVTPFARPNSFHPLIEATVAELARVLGPGNFEAVLSSGEPWDFGDADLVICSAGAYARVSGKGARDIATAVSDIAPDPNRTEGSLFVTLKSRTDIDSFADMKGRRVTVTGPNAFAGWHVALGEIAARGEDPDKFFAQTVYSGLDMTRTLRLLHAGEADVAVVRTCFLEQLQAAGADVSDIKPVAVRPGRHPAGCMTSTELYPGWTFLVTPNLDAETTRRVALALLGMKPGAGGLHWSVATDFSRVDDLFRTIRRGPYEYLRQWTVRRVWDTYKVWILLALLTLAGLAAHTLRSDALVRRRTRDLRQALAEQKRYQKKALEAQERMAALQRAGAVGQMSTIVAHELGQPLTGIIGYAHGIERLAETGNCDAGLVGRAAGLISTQARRAQAIVGKVRNYAKNKSGGKTAVDLAGIVRQAAATINDAGMFETQVGCSNEADGALVWADAMELELAVQNLMRNALEAAGKTDAPRVCAVVRRQPSGARVDGGAATPTVCIEVTDNGPELDDAAFARLEDVGSSGKAEGLGLGLSIVRLIARGHGGSLVFERVQPCGIRARLELPEFEGRQGPVGAFFQLESRIRGLP